VLAVQVFGVSRRVALIVTCTPVVFVVVPCCEFYETRVSRPMAVGPPCVVDPLWTGVWYFPVLTAGLDRRSDADVGTTVFGFGRLGSCLERLPDN